jgi:hypothetical protein
MKIKLKDNIIEISKDGVLYVGKPYNEGCVSITPNQARRLAVGLLNWANSADPMSVCCGNGYKGEPHKCLS